MLTLGCGRLAWAGRAAGNPDRDDGGTGPTKQHFVKEKADGSLDHPGRTGRDYRHRGRHRADERQEEHALSRRAG